MTEASVINNTESSERRYQSLLQRYHNMRHNMEGSPSMFRDPEGANKRLHKLHLRLLEVGESAGKNQHEVLADFLLLDRNLAEYDLPKIAVRDLPPTFLGDVGCKLIMDSGKAPEENTYIRIDRDLDTKTGKKSTEVHGDSPIYQEWLKKHNVVLIYYGYWGGMQWDPDITPAFSKKREALKRASKDFSLRVFEFGQVSMLPDMHLPARLYGLEVPAEKLEEIALEIRAKRDKYWITKEEGQNPYSKEVLEAEDKKRLWHYFSYLEHNQLELKKDSYSGIPKGREKTIQGWYDLFNVVEALGKHGYSAEEVFERSQESLRNFGSPYIPDEVRKDVEKLLSEGKIEEAEKLQQRLESLIRQ